jgi:hypothetical protein
MKYVMAAAAGACLLLLPVAGCKKAAPNEGESHPSAQYTQIDPVTAATVSGTIHFAGKMPAPVQIDMAQDPACNLGPTNYSEQYVGKNGNLQNVFLYIKDGLGNKLYAAPSSPVSRFDSPTATRRCITST